MKNNQKSPQEQAAAQCKKMRFITTVTGAFGDQNATLLILRFSDDKTLSGTKETRMRALIARAKKRGCERYVIARAYGDTGELNAFYIYTDLDVAEGEDVCRRWDLGSYEVQNVDDVFASAFQSRIWEQNTIPKNRFLFSPCVGIWSKVKAQAEQKRTAKNV